MTTYGFVSVHKYVDGPKEGERFLKFGKGDATASDIAMPTPDNNIEGMAQMNRKRILVHQLPCYPDERWTKAEVKEYLETEEPDRVWDALDGDDDD